MWVSLSASSADMSSRPPPVPPASQSSRPPPRPPQPTPTPTGDAPARPRLPTAAKPRRRSSVTVRKPRVKRDLTPAWRLFAELDMNEEGELLEMSELFVALTEAFDSPGFPAARRKAESQE